MFDSPAEARFWCICDNRILCDTDKMPLVLSAAALVSVSVRSYLPLDAHQQIALLSPSSTPVGAHWCGLRELLDVVDEEHFGVLGRAMQLAYWADTLRYCSRCGALLPAPDAERLAAGEYVKCCSRCEHRAYPMISPCVIVLVTHAEQCLLAQHQRSRTSVWTSLAGFIEPGESVEQALRREVAEEVGVSVGRLHYAGSQSWPFPAQLMLGFYAEYKKGEIVPDNDEIVSAAWFDYRNLPEIPPVGTISRRLIDGFIESCSRNSPRGHPL